MTRLDRRLRSVLAAALSSALVVLSPGIEAPRVVAQIFHAEPVGTLAVPVAPSVGPVAALTQGAPALTPPALGALLPVPVLPVSGAPAADFAPASAAAAAPAVAAQAATLSAPAAEPAPSAASASAPAAAPAQIAVPAKSVDSAVSYKIHRLIERTVAALTGAVNTLPPAGPTLTEALIRRSADRSAVISDYDDTLGAFSGTLGPDMVSAVRAVRSAGKTFDVISDRGDVKRGTTLTVFESLETLPAETRAGMYVAANSGGIVYRYDEAGAPVKVYEAPAMTDAVKAHVAAASESTKARLGEAGAVLHEGGSIPTESWGPYSYALMLKPGSSEASVRATAAILQAELDRRGVDVEVNPRFAKDPANPPYVTLSIITKEGAARYIAEARKASAKDVVILGDSMYVPHAAKKTSWLTRLGERASGRAMPALGNRTDANMERALPGALTLSVGGTGDPRAKNLFVLEGKGPEVTRRVLESVASLPVGVRRLKSSGEWDRVVLGVIGIVAALGAAYYILINGIVELLSGWESGLRGLTHEGVDAGLFGAAAGTLGSGVAGRILVNPAVDYAQARKKAVELAVARGASADSMRFVEATASMPVSDGRHWHYSFEIPGKNGGKALVYVDAQRFLSSGADLRVSSYEGASAASGTLPAALEPALFARGATVDPLAALDAVRREAPEFGAGVGVALDYRADGVSDAQDLWYRFFNDKGGIAFVNARTARVRVVAAPSRASARARD